MVVLYGLVASAGALASATLLWPYSWLIALLCAPLAGSALAALVVVRVWLRTRQQPQTAALDSVLATLPQFSTGLPDIPEASPSAAVQAQEAA